MDNEVTFDIYNYNDSTYPDCVILRIRQNGHWSSVAVTREAALIISASMDLYRAVKMDNDFLTPGDEAIKAGMNALDKAEGTPIGTRWEIYLHRNTNK
jgi:hypothetical protein